MTDGKISSGCEGLASWPKLEPSREALEVGAAAIFGDWPEESIADFKLAEDEARERRILDPTNEPLHLSD